jgi:NTP pyrophosphatase (non-canonical NTP hydrolase)
MSEGSRYRHPDFYQDRLMTQIDRLLGIMRRLRDPENGCPWDKEQTFATIAPYTLEETYEVLDAIAREDFDDLRGELGDLLFQVVFYAQMAQEEGRFDLTISAPPSATSWSAVIRIFSAMRPPVTAAKCWPAGSRSKALSERKSPSTPRWTIFRIACRR